MVKYPIDINPEYSSKKYLFFPKQINSIVLI